MKQEDLTKLKIDYIKRNIEYWVSELIKKQDALVGEGDFTGAWHGTAPNQTRIANRVMR